MKIIITDFDDKELEYINNLIGCRFEDYIKLVVVKELDKLNKDKIKWIDSVKSFKYTPEYERFKNIVVEAPKIVHTESGINRLSESEIKRRIELLSDKPL